MAAIADHTSTAEPPAPSTEKRWLDNPDFLKLFLRMFIRADEVGGIQETVELVRSLSEASGTSPQVILASIETYLLTYDPEHVTVH
jgi:hypothetical protein